MARLDSLVTVDRASPVPLYFQVAERLEKAIVSGEIPAGTRLDNEIELAQQLALSRPTMRRAIGYLVDKGFLVRRRGIGTQVVHTKVRRPLELTSLYDDLASTGQRPTTKVLANVVEPATSPVAHELGIPEGTVVVRLDRMRYAHDEPIARLRNYLPASLPELTTETLERQGLYQTLRASGVRIHSAHQTIGARKANAAEARLLDEGRGAALLTMQRTAYDDHGRVIEFGTHIYRASRYSIELSLLKH